MISLKKKFDGLLIVSDIDNTLMHGDFIPEENKTAIKYFTSNGGYFTIASGRNHVTAVNIANSVGANSPLICVNGGMIYDQIEGKKLHNIFITEKIEEYLSIINDEFPDLCFGYVNDDGYFFNSLEKFAENFDKNVVEDLTKKGIYKKGKPADFPKNISKAIIVDTEQNTDKIKEFGNSKNFQDVSFVKTAGSFLEVIPKNINKGVGVLNLANILGIDKKGILAIGDFDNDIEMLLQAHISAAPENAPQRIKDLVTTVVKPCEQGAVADFIKYIDNLY